MLSERAKQLKASPTLALAAKAKELKAEGHDVVSLAVGEPDWETPKIIAREGIRAIEEGFTNYTPASGIPELRKAIAQQMDHLLGLKYEFKNVSVTSGAKYSIFSALQVCCNPGDEVIIPAPFWVSYPDMVRLTGAEPKIIKAKLENRFKMTAEELENAITPRTKLLMLNSPSNPTGEVYSTSELQNIAKVLLKHKDIVVLSDDIYHQLTLTGERVAPHLLSVAPELKERTLLINGASKAYAMTGWRMGWGIGPENLIQAMTNFQSQSVGSASAISQKAALKAVQEGEGEVEKVRDMLRARRDFSISKLNAIDGIEPNAPEGAFYLWVRIEKFLGQKYCGTSIDDSKTFCQKLLEDEKVVVVPGAEFGGEGYLRMSYALENERMAEAVSRVQTFVSKFS